MTKLKEFFYSKWVLPIRSLLLQGVTPEKLALSLAVGSTMGTIPLLGTTTALCVLIAIPLRLNHVVMQIANYSLYPIHLAMIIPYLTYGQKIFSSTYKPLNLTDMLHELEVSPLLFLKTYALIALYGTLLWAITAPFFGLLIYFIFRWVFHNLARKLEARKQRMSNL